MVWAGVTCDGQKTPLIFIEDGVKVNSMVYLDLLQSRVAPWFTNAFGNKDYVFQQDGAPAHTSNIVQIWAKENFKGFWAKEIWPPSSPDLNTMDYSVWAILETGLPHQPHKCSRTQSFSR